MEYKAESDVFNAESFIFGASGCDSQASRAAATAAKMSVRSAPQADDGSRLFVGLAWFWLRSSNFQTRL